VDGFGVGSLGRAGGSSFACAEAFQALTSGESAALPVADGSAFSPADGAATPAVSVGRPGPTNIQ